MIAYYQIRTLPFTSLVFYRTFRLACQATNGAVAEIGHGGDIVRNDVNVCERLGINVDKFRTIFLPTAYMDQNLTITIFRKRGLP